MAKLKTPKTKMSKHLVEDRLDRVVYIATTIGFGDVVKETLVDDPKNGKRYHCITTTGVIMVKKLDKETIITMFIATEAQLMRLYPNKGEIPLYLLSTVRRNAKQRLMEKSEQYKA